MAIVDEIIKARVWWKVDTEANWNANDLILGPGEPAWVVNTLDQGVNVKVGNGEKKFSELPYFIEYDQAAYVNITGTALPSASGVGYSIVPEGTYTRAGQSNVVVPTGQLGILYKDGTTWSLGSSVEMPTKPTATIVIEGGDEATSQNAVYQYLDPVLAQSNALPFTLKASYVSDTGVITPSVNWISAEIDLTGNTESAFSIEGYGISSGGSGTALANTRVNYFNGSTYLGKSASTGHNSKFTFNKMAGTTKAIVNIDAATNVGADLPNSPYRNSFKFYPGTVLKDKTVKGASVDGRIETSQILEIESTSKISALSGNGAPKTQIGIDGNTYIDIAAGLAYKKNSGVWGNGAALGGQKRKFSYPAEFTWRPFDIFRLNSNGMYVPAITDISVLVIAEVMKLTPYYVDPVNGNDANSGLSEKDAVNTVARAIALGAALVFCMQGDYNRDQSIIAPIVTKNMAFIAYKGAKVNMSSWDNGNIFTWAQDGTTYYTTRAGTQGVFDTNTIVSEEEGYLAYTKAATLDDCKATAGSFFVSGTTVYVHTKSGAKPDVKIKLALQVETCKLTLGANIDFIYMEGIDTYTCNPQSGFQFRNNATTQYSGKVYVKNCNSLRNIQGNGVALESIKEVFVQNCGAIKCARDAMNYHTSFAPYERMKAVEMNCWSIDTGYNAPAEGSSNGSTAHDGMLIIRFGGKFDISRGSTIVDVNPGVRSLNFNVEASGSYLATTASYQIQDGKMWLYNCYAHTSTNAAKADGTIEAPVIYYDVDTLLDGTLVGNVIPV